MYDEAVVQYFLEHQMQLFKENVAESPEEAEEFLEDCMAVVWVDSEVIGNLVMKELADLDEITYVRFASVYRSFKDVDEIEELLQEITKTVRAKKESKK